MAPLLTLLLLAHRVPLENSVRDLAAGLAGGFEHGMRDQNAFTIQFPLTHEQLSFLTGAHRVSITRAMQGLKKPGTIIHSTGKR
jgi:hypothetical protein